MLAKTKRQNINLTFTSRFVLFHALDFLSHLTEFLLYLMKQRLDLLIRPCVKIVGSIHVMTFVLRRRTLGYVGA